jgi:starch phosphorylase
MWRAHQAGKKELCDLVAKATGEQFSLEVLTLGFARRATSYKRPKLLFADKERLFRIAGQAGGLQLVFAGKAHPGDEEGKFFIQDIHRMRHEFAQQGIKLVYLENYDMGLAKVLVSGVDVWLNTPMPPMEASGTSGMKAALNGVPSLSVLDGWWVEGCIEGVTGWAIEGGSGDAASLYDKLEHEIIPRYCERRHDFIEVMRHAMALNGSFFNTQRMMLQYLARAYFL